MEAAAEVAAEVAAGKVVAADAAAVAAEMVASGKAVAETVAAEAAMVTSAVAQMAGAVPVASVALAARPTLRGDALTSVLHRDVCRSCDIAERGESTNQS